VPANGAHDGLHRQRVEELVGEHDQRSLRHLVDRAMTPGRRSTPAPGAAGVRAPGRFRPCTAMGRGIAITFAARSASTIRCRGRVRARPG
jgi:hypothetical protein